MPSQQDTGVKRPDCGVAGRGANKQKGSLGAANPSGATAGATAEQQAQRCPRCDSLNTKFCYYNNYSYSQPRHFCKNCRRYWTKGGALRNVPVGGGCRKNKRLKHRDPSCLAAFGEVDASSAPNMLAAINGCDMSGFGASTSSLMQELAHEGHRQLALSRLAGMHVFDRRFMTDDDCGHSRGMPSQDLFALGAGSASMPVDPLAFPGLSNFSESDSQPLLFHHHQTSSELGSFFDRVGVTSPILPAAMDHFAAAATAPVSHNNSESGMSSTVAEMSQQLSLMHQDVHMNGAVSDSQHEAHMHRFQQQHDGQASAAMEEFADGTVEMNMAKNKSRSFLFSPSDWSAIGGSSSFMQKSMAAGNADALYGVPPHVSESTLWNASWPEMHAALAGSAAAAGAMLH